MNIIVYTKPQCPQCDWTKKLLTKDQIFFKPIDISESLEAENYVIKRSNEPRGSIQMPYVEITRDDGTGNDEIYDSWFGLKVDKIKGLKGVVSQ